MQTSQQNPIIKKKDDKMIKLAQRPVSASIARNDYNFRFNSKLKMPKKNSPLDVPHIYHNNFGITNPYLLSISNLKKMNINNLGNIKLEKFMEKAAHSSNNFYCSPKNINQNENFGDHNLMNNSMSNQNYPSLLLSATSHQNKLNLNKFKVVKEGKNIEKEKLYDDNIKLKEKINLLTKEMITLKSEIHKKDAEIIKTNKLMQEHIGENKNNFTRSLNENNLLLNNLNLNLNLNGNSQSNKHLEKSTNNQLIYNLKKQYKELKKKLLDKSAELESIKKTIKHTKLIELKIENQTLSEEIKNMNTKLENQIEKIKHYENLQSEYFIVLENFKKQSALANQLKEENESYTVKVKELTEKLNIQIKKQDLVKELEKKTKRLDELETELRIRRTAAHPDEFVSKNDLLKEIVIRLRDPKFLIDSQTNKQIALNSFFKSKIESYINELEKLDTENKKLREYLYILENNPNISDNAENKNKDNYISNNNSEKMHSNINKNYNDLPSTIELIDTKRNNQSSSISTPNTYLNEDQLKYFTYVLIKNFEVKKVDCNYLKEAIFGEDLSKLSIEKLATYLENHIINMLKIINTNDKNNVTIYTKSIIKYNKNDYTELKNSFISFFEIIKVYGEDEEIKLKNKLIRKFRNHKSEIISSIEYFDPNKSGIITFLTFKQVLQNINIRMSEKYTEYLIYLMKKINEDNIVLNLEELRYFNVLEILETENENILNDISSSLDEKDLNNPNENEEDLDESNLEADSELNTNEEENEQKHVEKSNVNETNKNEMQMIENEGNEKNSYEKKIEAIVSNEALSKNALNQAVLNSTENQILQENNHKKSEPEPEQEAEEEDEEEVVITFEQFNERVDKILSKLAEYLLSNKKTVKEFFCNYISIHNVTAYDYYDAITLRDFVQILQNIGVSLDTIDNYCIFTKLKHNDDYETINVSKLLDEMLNYGIFEDNFKGFCNPILENQEENKEITETSFQNKKENSEDNYNENSNYNKQSNNNMELISINNDLQNELLISLNNYLKLKNMTFDEFMLPKINSLKIYNDGQMIRKLILYDEFMKYCKDTKVITDKNLELDEKMKDLLCESDCGVLYINIQKISNCLEKMEKEFGDFEYEENNYEKENILKKSQEEENEEENYENNFENFIQDEENHTNKSSKVSKVIPDFKNKNDLNASNKIKNESQSKVSSNELNEIYSNNDENKSYENNAVSKDEEMKKQIEKHQKSLNSSLDLDNIEDMDVEGLD